MPIRSRRIILIAEARARFVASYCGHARASITISRRPRLRPCAVVRVAAAGRPVAAARVAGRPAVGGSFADCAGVVAGVGPGGAAGARRGGGGGGGSSAHDSRTPAQRAYDEVQAKRLKEEAKKMAAKSHSERVSELNEKLKKAPEHNDLFRISYGGQG